jgi:hypothetical protein
MKKQKREKKEISEEEFKGAIVLLNRRFNSWSRVVGFGMLQGASAVLGAALLVLILALVLEFLGLTELSEAIKLYGRYGRI